MRVDGEEGRAKKTGREKGGLRCIVYLHVFKALSTVQPKGSMVMPHGFQREDYSNVLHSSAEINGRLESA